MATTKGQTRGGTCPVCGAEYTGFLTNHLRYYCDGDVVDDPPDPKP